MNWTVDKTSNNIIAESKHGKDGNRFKWRIVELKGLVALYADVELIPYRKRFSRVSEAMIFAEAVDESCDGVAYK